MSGERVLVIDDDLELSEQVSDYLVLQGLEVSRAVDGDEALTMVAVRRYDLVLLDVIMPGIDGFAVCRDSTVIVWAEWLIWGELDWLASRSMMSASLASSSRRFRTPGRSGLCII